MSNPIPQAGEIYDEINAFWLDVEEEIRRRGCLRPFTVHGTTPEICVTKPQKGKWRVGIKNDRGFFAITDCNIDLRMSLVPDVPKIFEALDAHNQLALDSMSARLAAMRPRMKKFRTQFLGDK
jgi:hypothetical protein